MEVQRNRGVPDAEGGVEREDGVSRVRGVRAFENRQGGDHAKKVYLDGREEDGAGEQRLG